MKAEIKRHGRKPPKVNHVVSYHFGDNIMVNIDTKEKWPDVMEGFGGDEFFFAFRHQENNDCWVTVTLTPTTPKEKRLFKDCYCTKISSRYGASFLLVPHMPDSTRQRLLYEPPPRKRKATNGTARSKQRSAKAK